MRLRTLSAAAVICALAACQRTTEQNRPLATTKNPITNGTADTSAAHQAVVLIELAGGFCSGTLINSRTVLTAGHCIETNNPDDYTVGFGNDMNTATRVKVAVAMRHPGYDSNKLVNDVGLLRLVDDAPSTIVPIPPLPATKALTQADVGAMVDFIGFGQTSGGWGGGDYGTKLAVEDNLDVICDDPNGCLINGNEAAAWTICYDQQPGGPCSGDSGGPATMVIEGQEYVVGITSYGDQGCTEYGCSTKVDHFFDFIDGFMHPLDAGAVCTGNEQCLSGHCIDGFCCDKACDGGCEVCTVAKGATADGTCTPMTGACDDQNPCTLNDACTAGVCKGTQVQCPPPDQCNVASYCNRGNGQCSQVPKANGTACDDGDKCTEQDACNRGVCGGIAKVCAAPDDCHEAGSCNQSSGECVFAAKADGTTCSEGSCHSGKCSRCGCSSAGAALPGLALAALSLLKRRRR